MSTNQSFDWPGRWDHISKVVERQGPFNQSDFSSGETIYYLRQAKILVVGAGGLGCELLKNLALMGFSNIEVIDMDTIDLTNLNRQFLFREKDIGRPKAEVAAEFINKRIPGCNVIGHFKKIQDYGYEFYSKFNFIVCGLDSIVARRWINGMVFSMLDYDDDGMLDTSSIKPMIDGGTEGFKGNARVIIPGHTACIECTLDLFPPQVNFPLCTIANIPRLPEHCIEFVRLFQWPKEQPFGELPIDGDDPAHLQWIYEKSIERANKFNIEGVTYRLTQGVIKRIIPAVASTNAVIAAACSTEVFKLATSCCGVMDNYMVFNNTDGLYTYTYSAEKKEDCIICSNKPHQIEFRSTDTLQDIIDYLINSAKYQMKSPGITTTKPDGGNRTLYMKSVASIEEMTKPNLKKTLIDLNLCDGQQLIVADETAPNALTFVLKILDN